MSRLSLKYLSVVRNNLAKLSSACENEFDRFNGEESGLDIIEKLLILFVAVVILAGLVLYFDSDIWVKVKAIIDKLLGNQAQD